MAGAGNACMGRWVGCVHEFGEHGDSMFIDDGFVKMSWVECSYGCGATVNTYRRWNGSYGGDCDAECPNGGHEWEPDGSDVDGDDHVHRDRCGRCGAKRTARFAYESRQSGWMND